MHFPFGENELEKLIFTSGLQMFHSADNTAEHNLALDLFEITD